MEFSVIIPVLNRPAALRAAIRGVRANDYPADSHELIVVDNGSTDDTARVARNLRAHVISEPRPNRCRARNRGASEAQGAWLVFIDSDCVPAPDWLARLHETIATLRPDEPVGLIAGAVQAAAPENPVEAYIEKRRWIDQEKFLAPGRRFSPPFAATANLAIRRDLYLELGGLDQDLHHSGEDADFCWRAAAAGWRIRYEPRCVVVHHHRATLGALCAQAYHYGRGQADLFAKWRGAWRAGSWIESCHYVWALKGLCKSPLGLAWGRTPLARREPFYDFLANSALALGRLRGGLHHRLPIL